MSEFLCIHLNESRPGDNPQVSWLVLNHEASVLDSGSSVADELSAELPEPTGPRKVVLITPSDEVLLTDIDIPTAQQRHIKQVLPFIVEEQIIEPIENMHLAASSIASSGKVSVAAVKRELIQYWMDLFDQLGLHPDYLFLDVLCLPETEGQWHLFFQGRRVLFRHGHNSGVTADENTIKTLLRLAIGQTLQSVEESSLRQVLLSRSAHSEEAEDDVDTDAAVERFDSLDFRDEIGDFIRSENIDTQTIDYREPAAEVLAVNAVRNVFGNLNLMQGDFRAVNANSENIQIMKKAGGAIAACLAVFLLFSFAGGFYLNYKADKYYSDSIALYKDIFPNQRRVHDPVKQMKRKLSGEAPGSTSEFLPLLDAASRTLAGLDVASTATLTQLRYDAQRGDIVLDLRVNNIDVLETYKQQLASEGYQVDIMSANQNENFVNGRLQIGRI